MRRHGTEVRLWLLDPVDETVDDGLVRHTALHVGVGLKNISPVPEVPERDAVSIDS
jgi:hypothetical protein